MVTPNFEAGGSTVRDLETGICIEVIGTADFENVLIFFRDKRHGTEFRFGATVLARNRQGNLTWHLGDGARLCGYQAAGQVDDGIIRPGLSLEDIRTTVTEGLRIIASDRMGIPQDQVVLEVALAPPSRRSAR